ncbi:DNA topoisomerase I [Candidatus Woesearchaeota archaeon]|nr:DNA topoisomerase I [Candidatus Woesearchaeota archaeon]
MTKYELIITEKPNASKKVAEALADGKLVKKALDGIPYFIVEHQGKEIVVGCAVGHLYGLAEKEKTKGFSYPVFDIEWVPNYEVSKDAAFTKKYLDALKKLSKDADKVTVATDYDVEGEVIGLNVIRYACKRKDARRMKFSTLTREDLREAYEKASPKLDWGQAEAGETRHFLDFYYGINLSRALTKAIKQAGMFKILSTGRVQGPALKIVADREREIKAFKPVPFWQLELDGKVKSGSLTAWHEQDKFWEKAKVDVVFEKVKDERKGVVKEVKQEQFRQLPPFPFDLTSLQTEAYRLFGINPKQTLELAQELYVNGWISYPRTSSQQLPPNIGFAKILKQLGKQKEYAELTKMLLEKSKLEPHNGKKTDPAHPAIYPTGVEPKVDEKLGKIYDLIVKRFFATFGEPAVRETVTAKVDVKSEIFVAKGTRTIAANWHVFYAPYVRLEEEELPQMRNGEDVQVKKIVLHADETKPPKRYTPASLIKELEKRNLGTKATRAEIVETLKRRNYVTGEAIQVTDLGMETIAILEKYSPEILDEELTRHFELDMESIREGKKHEPEILDEARHVLTALLKKFATKEKEVGEELKKTFTETRAAMTTVGKCPSCAPGQLILRTGKFGRFIACDKYPECKTTFKLPAGGLVEVTPKICEHCKFPVVKMIKKGKRPQEVCINLDCPSKRVPDVVEKPCEKCQEGKMILRKSIYGGFLACNRFPKCRNIARLPKKDTPDKG